MPTKITPAAMERARALVAPEVETERSEIVLELAEADRAIGRLRRERTKEPDPQRRAALLPGLDAAEATSCGCVRRPTLRTAPAAG